MKLLDNINVCCFFISACRLGEYCADDNEAMGIVTPVVKATPTTLCSLLSLILLVVLFGVGIVGGACCYGYISSRTDRETEFFPT